MVQVECSLHCNSPEKGVQAEYNMQRDTQANPCIPDAGQTSTCQQTKILVPPWKLVLGGSGALSKWSRLIQTTLGCATCCTWCAIPDDPASADKLSTGGTGVRGVVFPALATGLSFLM